MNEPAETRRDEPDGADIDLSSLLEVVRLAQSADDVRRFSMSVHEREIWKRASLVRVFDKQLFQSVLSAGLPGENPALQFDRFVQNAGIELVSQATGAYSIKEDFRREYQRAWREEETNPPEGTLLSRQDFGQQLVKYFEATPGSDLDMLAAMALTNSAQARAQLVSLYDEADRRFDLARCHSLIKVIEDRTSFIDEDLRAECRQKRQYYRARCLFASDFYQTAEFYQRKEVMQELEPILNLEAPQWIFHFYATGGMGKSIFLHWLVARHCVPQPRCIPIARLDFDFFDLQTIGRHPWLVMLPIADQLNQQIAGEPFTSFLIELQAFAPLLPRRITREQGTARSLIEARLQSLSPSDIESHKHRFRRSLAEANLSGPILLVFDTLEEIMLSQQNGLREILHLVEKAHAESPNLRLILAGRYNLTERLRYPLHIPSLLLFSPANAKIYQLQPFSDTEALSYLKEVRCLTDKHPLRAILKRAKGNPFKLALFAELTLSKNSLTEKEVLEYPRADFAYLIERVVLRIQEPEAQWLLRYAVIPRTLTLEFFEQVMAPHLRVEMSKQRQLDRPKEKLPKGAEAYKNAPIWDEGVLKAPEDLNLQAVWGQLARYASGYGWFKFGIGNSKSPQLEPEVVIPMRELLRQQEVFPLLHQDAINYFEQKAVNEPDQWAQWTCEAIYHHFQIEGAAAKSYWQKKLESFEARQDPAIRKRVAAEVTGPDYVDEEGYPRAYDDQVKLISPEILINAHVLAAEASLALAYEKSERQRAWADVLRHMTLAAHIHRQMHARPMPGRMATLAWAAESMAGKQADVVTLLETLLNYNFGKQVCLSLELQLADALEAQKRPESLSHYEAVLKARNAMKKSSINWLQIRELLAEGYVANDRFVDAEREYKEAIKEAEQDGNQQMVAGLTVKLIELCLNTADFEQAESLLAEELKSNFLSKNLETRFQVYKLQARHFLALRNPLMALRTWRRLQETGESLNDTAQTQATLAELRGIILSDLMEFGEALDQLELAKNIWGDSSDMLGVDRCRMLRAELQLHAIGNMKEAYVLLEKWGTLSQHLPSDVEIRMELLRISLLSTKGDAGDAGKQWQDLRQKDWVNRSPRWRGRVLAAGLALGLADSSCEAQLAEVLWQTHPGTVWHYILEPFRQSHKSVSLNLINLSDYRAYLSRPDPLSPSLLPHALTLAAVLGLSGKQKEAERLLAAADVVCKREDNIFARCEVLREREGLDRRGQLKRRDSGNPGFINSLLKAEQRYPALYEAPLLEEAERAFERGDDKECESLLAKASERFKEAHTLNQWQARCEELAGKQALRRGDARQGAAHLEQASAYYRRLDQRSAVERITKLIEHGLDKHLVKPPLTRGGQPKSIQTIKDAPVIDQRGQVIDDRTYTVRIIPGKGDDVAEAWVECDLLGKGRKRRQIKGSRDLEFLQLLANTSGKVSDVLTGRLIDNTDKTCAALCRILFSGEEMSVLYEDELLKAGLRLEAPPGPAAEIPWELARVSEASLEMVPDLFRSFSRTTAQTSPLNATVMWAQISLNRLLSRTTPTDGIYGPQTTELVREFQRRFNLKADGLLGPETKGKIIDLLRDIPARQSLRVLIIWPDAEDDEEYSSESGSDFLMLESLYRQLNANLTVAKDAGSRQVESLLHQQPFQVVHLLAPLRQPLNVGEVYLDFSASSAHRSSSAQKVLSVPSKERRSGQLSYSVVRLNDLLQTLPDHLPRPLIILDVPRPAGITECVHQLLLRNRFAAELFHRENTGGVLATGLAAGQERRDLYEQLVHSLDRGDSLGEVTNLIRQSIPFRSNSSYANSDRGEIMQIIGSRSTALFTLDPTLPLLGRSV